MVLPSFRTIGDDRESSVLPNAAPSGTTPTQDRRTGKPCGQRSARCAAESFPTATSTVFQESIAVEPVPIKAGRRERAALENKVIGVFAVCNTAGICVHEIDHAEDILGGLGAKVGVLLDVVGNRTFKGIQNLFVGILAEDLPKGYGQAADLGVALGDQEAGRWVAGFFAVALVDHVAVVEESVPDPCGGSDQFSGEAIRLAARGNQFLEKLIDAVFILRHCRILQRVFCVFRGVFPFDMHILPSLSHTIKRL